MVTGKKPILDQKAPLRGKSPVTEQPERPKNWAFSFRFWKQIEFFGLDKSASKWFVSLLEKLADLSRESIDEFMSDDLRKRKARYHDISWTHKNIPIQRKDITWLTKEYKENTEEYPLVQFQISLTLGRIVGFWDERQLFNIVLLDPLHNIQPSKDFDYKVNPCSPLPCQYSTLLEDVDRVKRNECIKPECPVHEALLKIPGQDHAYTVTILRLPDDVSEDARKLIADGEAKSMQDIIESGILSIQESGQNPKNAGQIPADLGVTPSPPEHEGLTIQQPQEGDEARVAEIEFEELPGKDLSAGAKTIKLSDIPSSPEDPPATE